MIRRNRKSRNYRAPYAKELHMALESNFCATVRFNVQVQELTNINADVDEDGNTVEPMYFEF